MKIGLIDVDGSGYPNLALMRISAWHKAQGDEVEWWWSDLVHYDVVYMSKVFSDTYTPDIPTPLNAGVVIQGGTGYCITLGEDGKEHFDQSRNTALPAEMESMFPDYSIYPEAAFAVSMTSRGCPRKCGFCIVSAKEGRQSVKTADVADFYAGQKEIKVLDPNLTACKDKRDLMRQYRETGAWIDFTQGLDIRLLDEADIDDLNNMKIKMVHFAWDDPTDDLTDKLRMFAERTRIRDYRRKTVYILTNYNSTMEQNLFRIYTVRDLGFSPYVMIYNKPAAPQEVRYLQRWCNNKWVFRTTPRFDDYDPKKA